MIRRGAGGFVLGTVLVATAWTGAADVTLTRLLYEMTDLTALTTLPDPAFTCKQFSSYDRRSTDATVPTDENWFANADRGQHIRTEERNGETEWVLMDAAGPGAIVRIWSANPNEAGIVRVYLDGAEEPAIEMALQDMLAGETFPFLSPIAGTRARGWNSHLPIPYAKHCKVTCSQPDFYYQINYRTYEDGTAVETYAAEAVEKRRDLIEYVAQALAQPAETGGSGGGPAMPPRPARSVRPQLEIENVDLFDTTLDAGASVESTVQHGNGALCRLEASVDAGDIPAALRGCWLEITFDGRDEPSVTAPLGDFFGTAAGLNPYQALPCGVLSDGTMYANWIMPFREQALVKITNHSSAPVTLTMTAKARNLPWREHSLYFNAAWHAEFDIATQPRQDWNYISVDGAGRFVGDSLHITNPTPAWWGEGDEKIYVDGEDFPSHFGTGTEDYYGYAWCSPELFTHAYHNQPRCDGPGNYGHTNVNRFHIIDVIPFTTAFTFDMEVWHWGEVEVDMAATSYWYATPESTDNRPALDPELLRIPDIPAIPAVEGALEGERFKVESVSGGKTSVQYSTTWNWSKFEQLWWTDAGEGDTLELGFPVDEAGTYEVMAVFTTAVDYGIVTASINGSEPTEPIDLYHDGVVPSEPMSLGTHDLAKGPNTLTVKIVGTNPNALPKYMVGLDYLKLVPKS